MEFKFEQPKREIDFEEMWEGPIIYSYLTVLSGKIKNLMYSFEEIERQFEAEYGDPAKYEDKIGDEYESNWRIKICSSLHAFYGWGSVSLPDFEQALKSLSFRAKGFVQRQVVRAIDWILNHLIPFFKRFAAHLHVQGWSVGGGIGFPLGIGINISVTFEP